MHILTGTAYPHGYCIPSRVLHIVYTGCTSIFAVSRSRGGGGGKGGKGGTWSPSDGEVATKSPYLGLVKELLFQSSLLTSKLAFQ